MITLSEISKRYGDALSVDHVQLDVPAGHIHGVLGGSETETATLLRTVNLPQRPDSRIGAVSRHVHLLYNRNVAANVALPLKLSGVGKAESDARTAELLELVGLTDHAKKHPSQLTSGQRQRVAIARALAPRPEVLLCDEATADLDAYDTLDVLSLLVRLRDELGLSILIITGEIDVITCVADSASVLEDGRVVEQGGVSELLSRPGSRFAAQAFTSGDSLGHADVVEATFAAALEELALSTPCLEAGR
ncbi:MAG: ATP-binding cassette domain-containing protein [Stackebrandtia sp.]